MILGPTSHEIAGPESTLHGLSNHAQDSVARWRAVGRSKMRQAIHPDEDDAEGEMVTGETSEILPDVELGELVIRDVGAFVDAAVRGQSVAIAVPLRAKTLFVKTLRDADDRAMEIAQRSQPHQHVNRMSFFMAQLHFCFLGLAFVQGAADRASCAARDTTLIVTLHQNIVTTRTPHDLVPLVPGHPFGALVPELDLSVSVGHGHAGLQAVQHDSKDLRILKFRHRSFRGRAGVLIGRNRAVLQAKRGSLTNNKVQRSIFPNARMVVYLRGHSMDVVASLVEKCPSGSKEKLTTGRRSVCGPL